MFRSSSNSVVVGIRRKARGTKFLIPVSSYDVLIKCKIDFISYNRNIRLNAVRLVRRGFKASSLLTDEWFRRVWWTVSRSCRFEWIQIINFTSAFFPSDRPSFRARAQQDDSWDLDPDLAMAPYGAALEQDFHSSRPMASISSHVEHPSVQTGALWCMVWWCPVKVEIDAKIEKEIVGIYVPCSPMDLHGGMFKYPFVCIHCII